MKNTRTMKQKFPFRLGTTSYIIPDDILPNVQSLARELDDIELVLFESERLSNLPTPDTIDRLKKIANQYSLSYTVHLPVDCLIGHSNQEQRQKFVQEYTKVIRLTETLDPHAFIVHCSGEDHKPFNGDTLTRQRWRDATYQSLFEIVSSDIPPEKLCLETLDYPFQWLDEIIEHFNLSVCLDVGHLLLYGYNVMEHFKKYAPRIRVIHLHGIVRGHDHQSITNLDSTILVELISWLKHHPEPKKVLTLEVFNREDLDSSLRVLQEFCNYSGR